MNSSRALLLVVISLILAGSMAEAANLGSSPAPVSAAGPASLGAPSKTSEIKPSSSILDYNFYGDRYRDPFIPLVGEGHADVNEDRPPAVASLVLKGIVQDGKGRLALLASGVSSYILRGGRLYDGRNHIVKNISGVVKSESVIIIGADHTVRELRAKPAI